MKKRLHDKKAGIAILAALLILSLVDVILRATVFSDIAYTIANYGEALVTVVFSVLLLIFAFKGKDRVFYILCGAWLAFFIMNQLYGLPNMIVTLVYCANNSIIFGTIAAVAHLLSVACIIGIGALLVEYMNDGTIYNKAFNILCVITVVLLLFLFIHSLNDIYSYGRMYALLAMIHEATRLAMVFLFAFFAYDSAKMQLKKTNIEQ